MATLDAGMRFRRLLLVFLRTVFSDPDSGFYTDQFRLLMQGSETLPESPLAIKASTSIEVREMNHAYSVVILTGNASTTGTTLTNRTGYAPGAFVPSAWRPGQIAYDIPCEQMFQLACTAETSAEAEALGYAVRRALWLFGVMIGESEAMAITNLSWSQPQATVTDGDMSRYIVSINGQTSWAERFEATSDVVDAIKVRFTVNVDDELFCES